MAVFDYASAWDDLAAPAYAALPPEIKELDQLALRLTKNLRQGGDLLIPIPAELRAAMEKTNHADLALASRVISVYSHWAYGGKASASSGWKFSNCADQVLRAACGLPVDDARGAKNGYSFKIHEGILRCFYRDRDSWTRREICLGTSENLRRARAALEEVECAEPVRVFDVLEAALKPADDRLAALLDVESAGYMIPEELDRYRRERARVLKQRLEAAYHENERAPSDEASAMADYPAFAPKTPEGQAWVFAKAMGFNPGRVSVTNVNHRVNGFDGVEYNSRGEQIDPRHPFVIGAAHMEGGSTYIRPESAPCAYCRRPYSAHVSDKLMVIAGFDVREHKESWDGLREWAPQLQKAGFTGFMFEVPGEGRYAVTCEEIAKLGRARD
jgi:hypothetical protein